MPATLEPTLTPNWVSYAIGAGYVTVCPLEPGCRWALSSTGVPTISAGHPIQMGEDKSFTLEAGESLYLRGRGIAAITAKNPVP